MKHFIQAFLIFLLWGCTQPVDQPALETKWIDLTYTFDATTLYWPTSQSFQLDTVFEGVTDGGFYYSAYKFCGAEHGGRVEDPRAVEMHPEGMPMRERNEGAR